MKKLSKLKKKLKETIIKSPFATIEKIKGILSESSDKFNTLLILQGRLVNLKDKEIRGILDVDALNIEQNNLINSSINLVDSLVEEDISPGSFLEEDDKILNKFIEENLNLHNKINLLIDEIELLKSQVEKLSVENKKLKSNRAISLDGLKNDGKLSDARLFILNVYTKYQEVIDFYPRLRRLFEQVKSGYFKPKEELNISKDLKAYEQEFILLDQIRLNYNLINSSNLSLEDNNKEPRWLILYKKVEVFRNNLDYDYFVGEDLTEMERKSKVMQNLYFEATTKTK